jgi:hypothetical protein
VRLADGPEWRLLQVPELRLNQRLLVKKDFATDDTDGTDGNTELLVSHPRHPWRKFPRDRFTSPIMQ